MKKKTLAGKVKAGYIVDFANGICGRVVSAQIDRLTLKPIYHAGKLKSPPIMINFTVFDEAQEYRVFKIEATKCVFVFSEKKE